MTEQPKTIGQIRIRTDFNVTANNSVDHIKQESAKLIDFLEDVKNNTSDAETKRLAAIAQTKYEEAAMFAVKAVTK